MRSKSAFVSLAIIVIASLSSAQDAHRLRIFRPVDNRSVVRLQGTMHPRAHAELDQGPVLATLPLQHMTLVFSRTAAQQADLDRLLAEQQDRSSPNYHKWLTPEEYGKRFGLASLDVSVIAAWLQAQGFTVDEVARSRTWIAFSGIAAQVEAAFHTSIHNFVVDGQTHYAPSAELSVPGGLSDVVAAISGLHDFRPRVHSRARRVNPRLTSSLSGNHYLAPGDFGTIYNLPDYADGVFTPGNDGTGQTIGIVGQTTLTTSGSYTDNDTFRSVSKLPAANFTATLAGATPSFSSPDAEEANLDIQWSGAVAPNAAIIFAYSTNALTTSLQYLVNQNVASVISISYGDCEANFLSGDLTTVEGYLAQANAQGQTVTAAAGDVGAADCDGTAQNPVSIATHGLAVDYPASSVYVTAMGGTEFTGDNAANVTNNAAAITQYWNGSSDPNDASASAFSYIPEVAWNDIAAAAANVATGGGVSKQFTKPAWQTGNGVPLDGQRDVPDLALTSSPYHDGYILCSQGSCQTGYRSDSDQTFTIIGGTSAAAPSFAGVTALANQKLGQREGNLNPQIYSLVSSSAWAFHDITSGNNSVPCQPGTPDCPNGGSSIGYTAAPGYDLVTGWGSIDVAAFLNALAGTPQPGFDLLPHIRNLAITDELIDVVSEQGFSGTVTLSCSSNDLPGLFCNTNGPATVTPTTPGSIGVFVGVDKTQGWGSKTGTVTFTGTSGSIVVSVAVPATVTYQDFTLSLFGNAWAFSGPGSQVETLEIYSGCVFTQPIAVTCSSDNPQITCSPSTTTTTPQVCLATMLDFTITNASATNTTANVTFQGTSGPLTHTTVLPVTVTIPDFTLTASTGFLSISSGQNGTAVLTVAPLNGLASDVALTCTVTSSLGATTCSLSPATVTGGNGTSTLTIHAATLALLRGAPLPFTHRGVGAYGTLVFSLGMVLTLPPRRRPRGKGWRKSLLGLLLLGVMLGLVSCGGGSSGGGYSPPAPTPLSGTVTVTGTSGSLTHSVSIPLTIR